jgi:DNA-directed RNA polymerase specialized sigma24 family protein
MSMELALEPMPRRDWRLSQGAFERLLQALDSDRERAGVAYELLRRRIVGLMRWWGAQAAEELADQTLDRVARKLEEGAVVPEGSFGAYVRGVARMIFYEGGRASRLQPPDPSVVASGDPESERALRCLDRCLLKLEERERTLVLRYYADGNKAEVRRALASELGVSQTALRIRAHRLRLRLEDLVSKCLEGQEDV